MPPVVQIRSGRRRRHHLVDRIIVKVSVSYNVTAILIIIWYLLSFNINPKYDLYVCIILNCSRSTNVYLFVLPSADYYFGFLTCYLNPVHYSTSFSRHHSPGIRVDDGRFSVSHLSTTFVSKTHLVWCPKTSEKKFSLLSLQPDNTFKGSSTTRTSFE